MSDIAVELKAGGEPPRPNILYIDEQEDERANFFTDAYQSKLFENIYSVAPSPAIEDTIKEVLQYDIDALVSDFNLSEAIAVEYNGEDLVRRFLELRADFPCFIRTSHELVALETAADVNRVYSKAPKSETGVKADDHSGQSLFNRIRIQISHHQSNLSAWKDEIDQLLPLVNNGEADANDVDRLIELDGLVEAYFGEDAGIPPQIKANLFKQQDDLFASAEALIEKMKIKLGQADGNSSKAT